MSRLTSILSHVVGAWELDSGAYSGEESLLEEVLFAWRLFFLDFTLHQKVDVMISCVLGQMCFLLYPGIFCFCIKPRPFLYLCLPESSLTWSQLSLNSSDWNTQTSRKKVQTYISDNIQKAFFSQIVILLLVKNFFTGSVYMKYSGFHQFCQSWRI